MQRKLFPLTLAALAFSLTVVACGGSEDTKTPERLASSGGDTRTCPPRNPSFTYDGAIKNHLSFPVRLLARAYDCNDWDGVSTPGRTYTGKVILPGETQNFTLQPVKYTTRNWTMEFLEQSGGRLGTARLKIPQRALSADAIQAEGATKQYAPPPRPTGSRPDNCHLLPFVSAPKGTPDTSWSEVDLFFDVPLSLIYYKGRINLATECSYGSPA
ncbi:MAG: hypothetical protein ACKOQ5_03840 [Solirubrobacterales bacterium]